MTWTTIWAAILAMGQAAYTTVVGDVTALLADLEPEVSALWADIMALVQADVTKVEAAFVAAKAAIAAMVSAGPQLRSYMVGKWQASTGATTLERVKNFNVALQIDLDGAKAGTLKLAEDPTANGTIIALILQYMPQIISAVTTIINLFGV
jgi:hypothetical protein